MEVIHFLLNNLVALCWLIFLIFWIINWSWSKPTQTRRSRLDRFWYIITLLIGYSFFWENDIVRRIPFFNIRLVQYSNVLLVVADVIAVFGLVLIIRARIALGSNWSGSVQIKKGHELITSGPYRYVRHPIYTAVFLLTLASALLVGNMAALVGFAIINVSFYIKLRQEEEYMLRQFPDQYREYMERTYRLIPLVF